MIALTSFMLVHLFVVGLKLTLTLAGSYGEKGEKKERRKGKDHIKMRHTSPIHLLQDDRDKPYFKNKQLTGSQSHCRYAEILWLGGLGHSQQESHQRIWGSSFQGEIQ